MIVQAKPRVLAPVTSNVALFPIVPALEQVIVTVPVNDVAVKGRLVFKAIAAATAAPTVVAVSPEVTATEHAPSVADPMLTYSVPEAVAGPVKASVPVAATAPPASA